ncbi:putative RNA-binding ASCH domain protein [Blattamonas nauphoetae]|uniref:RNA-binding ASCH domain protein n=1 Tax=Blattamonas nauphoetae TaxID=2049346 RepID=A0ABQ9WSB2_9EUKA|nr:putative RNA-binding ASCH domain protein [Blattamonas nauphoetae]
MPYIDDIVRFVVYCGLIGQVPFELNTIPMLDEDKSIEIQMNQASQEIFALFSTLPIPDHSHHSVVFEPLPPSLNPPNMSSLPKTPKCRPLLLPAPPDHNSVKISLSPATSSFFTDFHSTLDPSLLSSFQTSLSSILFTTLGVGGILRILQQRNTAGSLTTLSNEPTFPICLPPPISTLLNASHELHHPKQKITVAGRALTKHGVRCSWWGLPSKGGEAVKNQVADDVLLGILNEAVWHNSHSIVHEVSLFEVRCTDGYGARWTADGSQFRGFLEPAAVDGHESGWIHQP